jgi:hypothetical protein
MAPQALTKDCSGEVGVQGLWTEIRHKLCGVVHKIESAKLALIDIGDPSVMIELQPQADMRMLLGLLILSQGEPTAHTEMDEKVLGRIKRHHQELPAAPDTGECRPDEGATECREGRSVDGAGPADVQLRYLAPG